MSIQKYIKDNNISFEGSEAVKQLAELCSDLGYGKSFENALIDFLKSNPGAIEAIYEFIDENYKDQVNDLVEPEKLFEIPVSWTMTGSYYVRARSLDQAQEAVYDNDFPKGEYKENTFNIEDCKEIQEDDFQPDESKILKVE